MIYRKPGFLSVVCFGSSPHPLNPPPTSPVSKLNWRHAGSLRKRDNLLTGKGAKSYQSKKAWSSLNHSILSGFIFINSLLLSAGRCTREEWEACTVPPVALAWLSSRLPVLASPWAALPSSRSQPIFVKEIVFFTTHCQQFSIYVDPKKI